MAGPVIAPTLTWPIVRLQRLDFIVGLRQIRQHMRAWRIIDSPYQVGRMPRGSRSNNCTPNTSFQFFNNFDAAGCVMLSTCASR